MARTFEFHKHSCEIVLAGVPFELDCSTEMGETMNKQSVLYSQLVADIKSGTKTTSEALALYCESIDTILGKGAANKIFEGREKNLDDVIDVLFFLIDTVKRYRTDRQLNRVNTSFAGNKRHGKKKKG